jgi:hypothetical protein
MARFVGADTVCAFQLTRSRVYLLLSAGLQRLFLSRQQLRIFVSFSSLYVCMYASMYVYLLVQATAAHIRAFQQPLCMYACTCVCMYVYVHTLVPSGSRHVCMYVRMYVCCVCCTQWTRKAATISV